ncbi:MAG: hypothetical protein J3K34DRAFT_420654 [Monoraphidium minutum]|nr:MAG: hypothetical protein J3K34DRAFT_420654 [Monoraphidium minutum]
MPLHRMADGVFPRYISRLQSLLAACSGGSAGDLAGAGAAAEGVARLVLWRREHEDRRALFSHYYDAVWSLNWREAQSSGPPPPPDAWARLLPALQLTARQQESWAVARRELLQELHRVASEWGGVLQSLALQLLGVPRARWSGVPAVQALVTNLAAERGAVLAFLHRVVDETLTPLQEAQLDAASYPWCPDVWQLVTATAAATRPPAPPESGGDAGDAGGGGKRGGGKRGAAAAAAAEGRLDAALEEDPMSELLRGFDKLQPLMPQLTAFQLLRAPTTARGAGLRLKRAMLIDPYRTVVPASAYTQPSAAELSAMSVLDAHCGAWQEVMLYDWLRDNQAYLQLAAGGRLMPATTAAG